jgi:hypothetical protein
VSRVSGRPTHRFLVRFGRGSRARRHRGGSTVHDSRIVHLVKLRFFAKHTSLYPKGGRPVLRTAPARVRIARPDILSSSVRD